MLCLEETPLKGPINATKYVHLYHVNAIDYTIMNKLSGYAIKYMSRNCYRIRYRMCYIYAFEYVV